MTTTTDIIASPTATTAPGSATPGSATPAPATRFRRRAAGVASIAAGVLTFAGFAATPWEGSSDTALYLQALADHPLQAQVAATLLHFGYLLMVPAVLAIGQLVRRRSVVLGHIGMAFGLLGTIGLPGLLVVDFYGLTLAEKLPIDQAVAIEEGASGRPFAALMAAPSALGMAIGLLLLTIAAARAGRFSWWVVPLLPIGFVVTMLQPALLPAVIGSGLVMIVFIAIGVTALRTSDHAWETGA
jgi:hypothetical protein